MIEIKQAVNAAIDYLRKLYDNPSGIQLEEVFRSDDDRYWLVTLSFLSAADPDTLAKALQGYTRKFKTLEVDGQSGEVRSMKIRPVPSV